MKSDDGLYTEWLEDQKRNAAVLHKYALTVGEEERKK